jgi:hypothetical protein
MRMNPEFENYFDLNQTKYDMYIVLGVNDNQLWFSTEFNCLQYNVEKREINIDEEEYIKKKLMAELFLFPKE